MRVSGIGASQRHFGRRLVSCLVAYAFALQMVLFAFAAPAVAGHASDEEALAAGLWTASEELTGVRYSVGAPV